MSESDSTTESTTTTTTAPQEVPWQTSLRLQVTPFLPPPVVQAFQQVDQALIATPLGPEPSITLLTTTLLLFLLASLISSFTKSSSGGSGGGSAIQDDVDEDAIVDSATVSYDETILLCGPSLAGKTSLFCHLTTPSTSTTLLPTVASIKPNTGYVAPSTWAETTSKDSLSGRVWRILDTPGHWSPAHLITSVWKSGSARAPHRILLVLDATQTVSKAADIAYHILAEYKTAQLLVVAHKCQAPKAKNVRRLKLQLRNELERISQLQNLPVQWEERMEQRMEFLSTSLESPQVGLEELKKYLVKGSL
eukprot:Nitzschia sp. Nitz4//scaffold172_size47551//5625//6545//NITZ4_007138-RA/size47551-processed-gene-0.24-mRNA-1//-1//CDS//3329538741//1061//frame0